MKRAASRDPGPRVFIAALRSCQIVYLPETGQIVSLFESREGDLRDDAIRTASPAGEDDLLDDGQ